jgi:hypothetical protein
VRERSLAYLRGAQDDGAGHDGTSSVS